MSVIHRMEFYSGQVFGGDALASHWPYSSGGAGNGHGSAIPPIHRSQQDMGVGIVSRRMGVMDGKVSNHAFGNKLLLAELPDKDSVLVGRYLSGDGKHPPPCKLGVPLFFHRFGCGSIRYCGLHTPAEH